MQVLFPILLGGVLLFGGAYLWWHVVERRFTVLTPGEVFRSGTMGTGELQRMVRRHGIRSVVDLRKDEEGDIEVEDAALTNVGCLHFHLPSTQVPEERMRDQFLEWMEEPGNRPALIHCTHGEGRAVVYGALWLIEFCGMEPERARKSARLLTTRGSSFDPKRSKGRYLREYQPRRRS